MKAIILAAGRGARMGKLTEDCPKCLIEFRGKPLLEWQMEALRAAGIAEIGVVRGYLGHMLEGRGLRAFENPRWSETNMVVSLLSADGWLRAGTCIVSYSDIVYSDHSVRLLVEHSADISITYDPKWVDLWRKRFGNVLSDAETFRIDAQGRLLEIGNRATSLDGIQGQYMGLLKFTPRGWRQMEELLHLLTPTMIDNLSMTGLLERAISHGLAIYGVAIQEGWLEVDSPSDLLIDSYNPQ